MEGFHSYITASNYVTTFGFRKIKNWWSHCLNIFRSEINVTFWDYVAEDFQNHINNITFEEPLIIIVASGKVSKWQGKLFQ